MARADHAPGDQLGGGNPGEHGDRTTLAHQGNEINEDSVRIYERPWFRIAAAGSALVAAGGIFLAVSNSGSGSSERAAGGRAATTASPNPGEQGGGNTGGIGSGNFDPNKPFQLRPGVRGKSLDQIVGPAALAAAAKVDPTTLHCQEPVPDPAGGTDFACTGESANVTNNFEVLLLGGPSTPEQPLIGVHEPNVDGVPAVFDPQLGVFSLNVGDYVVNVTNDWPHQPPEMLAQEDGELASAILPAFFEQQ